MAITPRKNGKRASAIVRRAQKAVKNSLIHGVWCYQNEGIAEHFEDGNADRLGWPPLTLEYALRKRKEVGTQPILVFTGNLRDSVVGKGEITKRGDGVRLKFPEMERYGKYVGQVRDFLTPDAEDMAQIRKDAQAYINAQAKSDTEIDPLEEL